MVCQTIKSFDINLNEFEVLCGFATASGLNRYDGCQMTLFRSNNADPASLPDNYIKSIQEDYKGNLWILTGVGYVIYNSESETFDREVHAWLCEVGIDGTPALVYIDHNKKYVVLYKRKRLLFVHSGISITVSAFV